MPTTIQKSTLNFLKQLRKNNNREWFAEHKPMYQAALENVKAFQADLLNLMSEHDEIENSKLFRIYKDVRFSKDKTPYKNNFGGSFVRATKWRRGGYYFQIEPDNCFIAGGFWNPNAADLKRIRTELSNDADEYRKILNDPDFIKVFGTLQGDQVKTAPRGFAKDDPAIDLLRYKQHIAIHKFDNNLVLSDEFIYKVNDGFKALRPFFDYMSTVLTTDENGVPIE